MKQVADQVLWYRGEFDAESCCRVRVYRPSDEERFAGRIDVVIVSNTEENPGTKPCFSAETLAVRLWKKLRRPAEYVYIEHRRAQGGEEQFEEVVFQTGMETASPYKRPGGETLFTSGWLPLTREEVEEVTGVPLQEAIEPK